VPGADVDFSQGAWFKERLFDEMGSMASFN